MMQGNVNIKFRIIRRLFHSAYLYTRLFNMQEELLIACGLIITILKHGDTRSAFPQRFCSPDSFWLRKITTDPHILPHVNTECPDDRCPKLEIYIS